MGELKHTSWKKLAFFKLSNVISLMWPCFFLSRVVGIFRIKVSSSEFAVSKTKYIISTFTSVIYVSVSILLLYQLNRFYKYDTLPEMLQHNYYIITGCIVVIMTYSLNSAKMDFLQDLTHNSRKVPVSTFHKKFILLKDISGFLFLIGQMSNIYSSSLYSMFYKIWTMYATIIMFLTDMMYMNCIIVLFEYLKNIDNELGNMRKNILMEEIHLLRRIYHEKHNSILLAKLKMNKKAYYTFNNAVDNLTSTFSWQIAISFALNFAEITFNSYFYLMYKLGTKLNVDVQIFYPYFITPVIYYSLKMLGIISASELIKRESSKTGKLVHGILGIIHDKQIMEEVCKLELFLSKIHFLRKLLNEIFCSYKYLKNPTKASFDFS